MTDVISYASGTVTGNPASFDITGDLKGETFSAAIILYSQETTDDTDNANGFMGVGFVAPDGTSAEEGTRSWWAEDGDTAFPDTHQNGGNSGLASPSCILITTTGGTVETAGTYGSSITDGVRIALPTSGTDFRWSAILFGGLSRAYTGVCNGNGVSEDVGDTGVGTFRPKVVVFTASDGNSNSNNLQHASPNLGFAIDDGTPTQVCSFVQFRDATEPSQGNGDVRSADAFMHRQGGTTDRRCAITFDATGFDGTVTGGGVGVLAGTYLALLPTNPDAFRVAAANLSISASTGDQSFPLGFNPDAALGIVTALTSEDTPTSGADAGAAGLFMFGRDGFERAFSMCNDIGISIPADISASDASSIQGAHALLLTDDVGTVTMQASRAGPSGGGFKLNFTTAGDAGIMTILGFQIVPTLAPQPHHPRLASRPRHRLFRRPKALGGKAPGNPPILLTRLLKAVARIRRAMQRRLRKPISISINSIIPIPGAEVEETKLNISSPGMTRGVIVGPGTRDDEPL